MSDDIEVLSYQFEGDFVTDAFFDLWVPLDTDILELSGDATATRHGFISHRREREARFLWAEVLPNREEVRNCPLDSRHVTGTRTTDIYADLYGGTFAEGIVPDSTSNSLLVTRVLRDRLEHSGLTGFRLVPLRIGVNQSQCSKPELYRMEVTSSDCIRRRTVRVPDVNLCPFCGHGPVVCPACKRISFECERCQRGLFVSRTERDGPSDRRFVVGTWPGKLRLLESALWDGADVMPNGTPIFVTKRVVDFLLGAGAAPFIAQPISMDFRAASKATLARLERARHSGG